MTLTCNISFFFTPWKVFCFAQFCLQFLTDFDLAEARVLIKGELLPNPPPPRLPILHFVHLTREQQDNKTTTTTTTRQQEGGCCCGPQR